ncbi:hypothetical protein L2D25_02250 [Salmonella enterica subsp. enterica serovar Muenchen]|uniref:hypothetical protein n=1 Tax=Salmonella enterica TaxID=28901 RepID=UPI000FA99688|nr:hypothetical protein [Salmonella enterica]EBW4116563.1 hypothetical protein [Salmonella enterica subsp. enterica serovar Oranienburg]ECI3890070.1 hypothetical protein [Salmonella enterica subsp. enterica serovar Gombe]ECG5862150.1 hypothetical protein [Salmonella enterica subsp. enterica serovar Oranienburg]ECW1082914.1 hypothetical protein [Salmonella enterica]ECY7601092.1 hypothetical protein [Salmonella enterica subsp. enterica serovar Muenchen]
MKKIIFILALTLISFSSFSSAETKSSKNDEGCRVVASQIGGVCENGWVYVTKKDELRGTQEYLAFLFDEKPSRLNKEDIAALEVASEDNKKMDMASLFLGKDSFTCDMKKKTFCKALMRVNDGEIFVFYYFMLNGDNKIAYFRPSLFEHAHKIVIEIPTSENKKRQFVFYAGDIKWSN